MLLPVMRQEGGNRRVRRKIVAWKSIVGAGSSAGIRDLFILDTFASVKDPAAFYGLVRFDGNCWRYNERQKREFAC